LHASSGLNEFPTFDIVIIIILTTVCEDVEVQLPTPYRHQL